MNWEHKAARRKCSKALAPILGIVRKDAVDASLNDAAPSLSHLEASRAVLGLAAAARGATSKRNFDTQFARGEPLPPHGAQ